MDTAVSLSDVSFQYKGADTPALTGISLSVDPGRCAVIQGGTASGKTTLCRCLNGLVPQALEGRLTGDIIVAGKDVSCFRTQTLAKDIGFVMQDPETQIVGRTVFEDLAFGPANMGVPAEDIRTRIPDALAHVGLAGYENRDTAGLSGGEKQRLAIAGILAMSPSILVLDEPASELDPRGRAELYARLDRLRQSKGITLIIVEPVIHDILPMMDHVLILDKGRVAKQGPPSLFRFQPQAMPVATGSSVNPGVKLPVERSDPGQQDAPLLEINGLTFGYDHRPVLTDINLKVEQGDFIALMGHNGAGKTTLVKHLNGLIPSDRVRIKGKAITDLNVKQRARTIGFVFQNPDHQIFETSVEKEISFGLKQVDDGPVQGQDRIKDRVEKIMKQTGLAPFAGVHPFTLPKGLRQLVAVASAAVLSPGVLVVDEPFTGLDVTGSQRVMDLIQELHAQGTAIVLITHDLALAAREARRLVVMAQGRIIADGPMAQLLNRDDLLTRAGLVPTLLPDRKIP